MHPSLTLQQMSTIGDIIRAGANITGIVVHPYSGAATLYQTDSSDRRHTAFIINPDGTEGYKA